MRLPLAVALCCVLPVSTFAKGPKVHSAAVGKGHPVYWADPQGARLSLIVRPLIVDGRRKEWVIGDAHDVTDHSFVVLQVQHLNDAMPGEKTAHYIWQTGGWLMVERNTGHVTMLHLSGYDPALSGISWFRDYSAYCALTAGGKSLYAEVAELGQRKPVARKKVSPWPLPPVPAPVAAQEPAPPPNPGPVTGPARRVPSIMERMNTGAPHPVVCSAIEWMRDPLRAIVTPRADLPPVELDLSQVPAAAANPPESTE